MSLLVALGLGLTATPSCSAEIPEKSSIVANTKLMAQPPNSALPSLFTRNIPDAPTHRTRAQLAVNLGGWFVGEGWMIARYFSYASGTDEVSQSDENFREDGGAFVSP